MIKENSLLITNALLLYDNNEIKQNAGIYIKDGIIKEIDDSTKLKNKHSGIKTIDAGGRLVTAGFINSHMHFYSTFARGIPLKSPPARNFVDILENLWWKLDKLLTEDEIYYSAVIPMISAVKTGTTTIIDHHSSPNCIDGSLEIIKDAYDLCGLRGAVCYEVSDRDGKERRNKGIDENLRFIKKYNTDKKSAVKGMFGLHAAFTLEDDTMEIIKDHTGRDFGFHIHVSEAKDDNEINKSKYGMSATKRLHHYGITGEKSIFAHCNHVSENDISILKESKTNIVHNPQSNMNNAVGTADIIRYLNEGITVGLGTDGMSAGICDASYLSFLIHKHNKSDSNIAFDESRRLLMDNNPKIASRILGCNVGKIKESYPADIIITDYLPATPFDNDTYWGHFLFSILSSLRVRTTIAGGEVLMEDYQLKNIDEIKIHKTSQKLAKKIWENF